MFGENDPRLGRTGMPTAIQLTLEFKETVILTKASMKRGTGGYKGTESIGNKAVGAFNSYRDKFK
jgi:hypothetical protein